MPRPVRYRHCLRHWKESSPLVCSKSSPIIVLQGFRCLTWTDASSEGNRMQGSSSYPSFLQWIYSPLKESIDLAFNIPEREIRQATYSWGNVAERRLEGPKEKLMANDCWMSLCTESRLSGGPALSLGFKSYNCTLVPIDLTGYYRNAAAWASCAALRMILDQQRGMLWLTVEETERNPFDSSLKMTRTISENSSFTTHIFSNHYDCNQEPTRTKKKLVISPGRWIPF